MVRLEIGSWDNPMPKGAAAARRYFGEEEGLARVEQLAQNLRLVIRQSRFAEGALAGAFDSASLLRIRRGSAG